jgi:MarR family transcriptional regulator for hemolysin
MAGKHASAAAEAEPGNKAPSFALYRSGETTPEIRLTVALVLVARRWRALLDERLRPIEQSSARMEAMSAIMNAQSPNAQIDIARRLRIEGPTMTRMIDALSEDGLVERNRAPHDRRTKFLTLTDQGEEVLERIFETVEPLRNRLLEGLSEEQMEQMNGLLSQLLARLDEGLPEPGQEAARR